MRGSLVLALSLLAALPGCMRHPIDAILICHNANCAAPGTVDQDDEMSALQASLPLISNGRPTLDGVEIDTVWERTRGECQFAHGAGTDAPAVGEATKLITDFLARDGDVAWHGDRFYMKMELKTDVDGAGDGHTDDEKALHADCILDQIAAVEAVATAHDRKVTFLLDSAGPDLLLAVQQRPRWPGKHPGETFEIKFEVDYDTSVPEGLDPDVLTIRWGAIDEQMRVEFDKRGKQVLAWGRDPSTSTLDDLEYLHPTFIGSNQALFMRDWLAK